MSTFKKRLFEEFATIAKALSSGNRLEILELLAQCEYSVEDLARIMDLTIANTSHHLQQLRRAGLVLSKKQGKHVFYRLKDENVVALLETLRTVASANLAEVDSLIKTFLVSRDSMEPLSRNELLERASSGLVTVLDVRPSQEFASGHVPGAINIPLADLLNRLNEFDPKQEIVAYCRGPHCILAFEAVKILREKGFHVRRLEDGYPEWKMAGLPVENNAVVKS